MVAILPPRTDIGSAIGAGLGQGMGQGIARGSEIGFQRKLLQDALQKAGDVAKTPGVSPIDRTMAYLNAFAAIPGSERYAQHIIPMLNQMAAFEEDKRGSQANQGNQLGQGSQAPAMRPKMIGGQMVPEGAEAAFPQEETDLYEPFLGPGVKRFSQQQIAEQEYKDYGRGMQSSPVASFMRTRNEDIQREVDRISERQQKFANYYSSIHPDMAPDDQRIAQKFYRSKDALQAPTNEEKARAVDNLIDRYRNLRTNMAHQIPRSLIGKARNAQINELHNEVDWLLKEGQVDLAKQILTKDLGLGDAESEYVIQKPTKQQESILGNLPKMPELGGIKIPTFGKSARLFEDYSEDRGKKLNQYEDALSKAIQPGTAKKHGTSLLVLRDMAMKSSGMEWTDFNRLVHKMISEGKITLDPYQTQELPKLKSAPHAGFFDMLIERK